MPVIKPAQGAHAPAAEAKAAAKTSQPSGATQVNRSAVPVGTAPPASTSPKGRQPKQPTPARTPSKPAPEPAASNAPMPDEEAGAPAEAAEQPLPNLPASTAAPPPRQNRRSPFNGSLEAPTRPANQFFAPKVTKPPPNPFRQSSRRAKTKPDPSDDDDTSE